jgi:hypothetical protein
MKKKTIFYGSDVQIVGTRGCYIPDQYGFAGLPTIGDEYVIFTSLHMEPVQDSSGIPYNIFPMSGFGHNGGLYKVLNGNVQDIDNVFGLGYSPGLVLFISELESRITTLTNQ